MTEYLESLHRELAATYVQLNMTNSAEERNRLVALANVLIQSIMWQQEMMLQIRLQLRGM
jgi:hypothetical protein